MKIDHGVVMQLWDDPFFWESVPELDKDREIAEALLVNAEVEQSSLSIKHSQLYNEWIRLLEQWATTRPDVVTKVTDYIHKKRGYRPEALTLPSGIVLSTRYGEV
jgi:hypothetical protein|tara:strand:+ start:2869 stop:3183 length:315 start_codon:yes stop_codon:yes gene_type:complete